MYINTKEALDTAIQRLDASVQSQSRQLLFRFLSDIKKLSVGEVRTIIGTPGHPDITMKVFEDAYERPYPHIRHQIYYKGFVAVGVSGLLLDRDITKDTGTFFRLISFGSKALYRVEGPVCEASFLKDYQQVALGYRTQKVTGKTAKALGLDIILVPTKVQQYAEGQPTSTKVERLRRVDVLRVEAPGIRIPAQNGGCWYCERGDHNLVFCCEFDTNVHTECVQMTLEDTPDDLECQIIARELGLIKEVTADA